MRGKRETASGDLSRKNQNLSAKAYFIVWAKFQRRPLSMQPFFGFNTVFIPTKIRKRPFKIFDYLYKSVKSAHYLVTNTPQILWIQLPPTPLLNLALLYRSLNKKTIVIADCHNGTFSEEWVRYLNKTKTLNRADIIVTHNHVIKELALSRGADPKKVIVLETKPASKPQASGFTTQFDIKTPWILMPCAFAEDEPIATVFEAAKLMPEITIVISGDVKSATGLHDISSPPSNVVLIGFLPKQDYEVLFCKADAVLGLTTEHHVQLSVANEATGFGMPMILSDTPLLRELFGRGAVYVDTFDPASIATGTREAIQKKELLAAEVNHLREERNAKWYNQAHALKAQISKLIATRSN